MAVGKKNLRIGRWSEKGRSYHITAATQDRRPIFADLRYGRIVVNSLRWSDAHSRTATWAFVVMPDHLHWLFQLESVEPLSKVVASVKKFSARRISSLHRKRERIWIPGFHDHAIRRDESLIAVARYIVMNPVRGGLVVGQYSLWDAKWIRADQSVDPGE